MKHSPVIHVTLLPINTKRSVYEHSDRVHSSVLYPCDQCAKSFICKQNLKIHAKIHYISEKAFTCEYCEKGFMTSAHLKRHVENSLFNFYAYGIII